MRFDKTAEIEYKFSITMRVANFNGGTEVVRNFEIRKKCSKNSIKIKDGVTTA